MSKVFYKAKNLIMNNGFLRNPDRYYLEEYFEQIPTTKLNPILDWNYIECAAPIVSAGGKGSDNGAFTEGTNLGMIFPGKNGELYPAQLTFVGNFTTSGILPIIEGTIPDSNFFYVKPYPLGSHDLDRYPDDEFLTGLNLQLDHESTDNSGCQITIGPENGNSYSEFIVGTHSGYIEATFFTSEWSNWDVASIGFRKAGQTQLGHNAVIGAGTGDPLYTDFATFGVQEADKIKISTSLDGTTSFTNIDLSGALAGSTIYLTGNHTKPKDSVALRIKVWLLIDGTVKYQVQNRLDRGQLFPLGGDLRAVPPLFEDKQTGEFYAPDFKFNTGTILIPYLMTHCIGQVDNKLLLKDIKIYKSDVPSLSNLNTNNKYFTIDSTPLDVLGYREVLDPTFSYSSDRVGLVVDLTGRAVGYGFNTFYDAFYDFFGQFSPGIKNINESTIMPFSGTKQSPWDSIKWGTQNEVEWECALSIQNTALTAWAGLKLTSSYRTTDIVEVYFKTQPNLSPNLWNCVVTIDYVTYVSQIPENVTIDKIYKFRITIDSARFARVYINDIQYNITTISGLPTIVEAGALPSQQLTNNVNLIPYIGIEYESTDADQSMEWSESGPIVSSILNVYYQKISRKL